MKREMKMGVFFFLLSILIGFSCTKENIYKEYGKPEVTIRAGDNRLANDIIHLQKDTVYVLATDITRYQGQTLQVDAGTLIKVNDGLSITINPGAKIEAIGTATQPIIFTSSAPEGTAGFTSPQSTQEHSWIGINIFGNSSGAGDTSSAGSGNLSFARIEFAGASINNANFSPSLALTNVGKATTIENIQVSYSVAWSSFQFSGGNCNAKNLVSYASGNSDFVLTDGYSGNLQHLFAYRHPFFAPALGSGTTVAGLLIKGFTTNATISNITVLGPGIQTGVNPKYYDTLSPGPFGSTNGSIIAAIAVTGGVFHIRNAAFLGFPKTGFLLGEYNAASALLNGVSDIMYSTVQCPDLNRSFYISSNTLPPYTSADFRDFILQENFANQLYFDEAQLLLTDPYNYDTNPNPFPATGSILLSSTNFDGALFSNSFFDKVTYRGALGANNWMSGWANFLPLQTNYNN